MFWFRWFVAYCFLGYYIYVVEFLTFLWKVSASSALLHLWFTVLSFLATECIFDSHAASFYLTFVWWFSSYLSTVSLWTSSGMMGQEILNRPAPLLMDHISAKSSSGPGRASWVKRESERRQGQNRCLRCGELSTLQWGTLKCPCSVTIPSMTTLISKSWIHAKQPRFRGVRKYFHACQSCRRSEWGKQKGCIVRWWEERADLAALLTQQCR